MLDAEIGLGLARSWKPVLLCWSLPKRRLKTAKLLTWRLCHFSSCRMASHAAAEPVLVKVRSRAQERAAYVECAVHVDGSQLRLVKRGGPADVIVLSSLDLSAVSMTCKRGRFYVAVETVSKTIKLKLSTAEAQTRWFETFRQSVIANETQKASPNEAQAQARAPSPLDYASKAIPVSPLPRLKPAPSSFDGFRNFSPPDAAVERMATSFQNSSLASDSSATHSSFSSFYPSTPPPLVPPRPDYSFMKHRHSKAHPRRYSSIGTSSSSSASMMQPLDPQTVSPAASGHALSPDHERFSVIESVDGFQVETVFLVDGRVTSL